MAMTDEKLKKDVVDQLFRDSSVDASRIKVDVLGGIATLTGFVSTFEGRDSAESDAASVRGIDEVDNRLAVDLVPTYTPPSDDEIKREVESLLASKTYTSSRDIKISVETGVVKLEGTVSWFRGKEAVERMIKDLDGVIDVENHLAIVPTDDKVDKEIANRIEAALDRDKYVIAKQVDVTVGNGKAKLSGKVPSSYALLRAYNIVATIPRVAHVAHDLKTARDP